MPIPLRTVDDLGSFLGRHLATGDPRTPHLDEQMLKLLGAVLMCRDPGTELECNTAAGGEPGKVVFATINGKRYAFVGVADHAIVEIREGNLRGRVMLLWSSQPLREVIQVMRERL